MEESMPAQTDFLDLRRTLAELSGGVFTLLCAAVTTLYALCCAARLILEGNTLGAFGLGVGAAQHSA